MNATIFFYTKKKKKKKKEITFRSFQAQQTKGFTGRKIFTFFLTGFYTPSGERYLVHCYNYEDYLKYKRRFLGLSLGKELAIRF
jgi:hypothetical protein